MTRESKSLRRLSLISSWAEFKELWDSTEVVELLHGLLFWGFRIEGTWEEKVERIMFYLSCADREDGPLAPSSDHPTGNTERGILRGQAFKVLCEQFFKKARLPFEEEYVRKRNRWMYAQEHELLMTLFHFFRAERRGGEVALPLNLGSPQEYQYKVARDFGQWLCCYVWRHGGGNFYRPHGSAPQKARRRYRPLIVRTLASLDGLHLIGNGSWGIDTNDLDFWSLRELGRIAMRPRIGDDPYSRPRDLDEACAVSPAARRLNTLLTIHRGQKKWTQRRGKHSVLP